MSLLSDVHDKRFEPARPAVEQPMTLGDELRTMFAVLFGGWPVYLAAMAAAIVLALLFVLVSPQMYLARTELLLEPRPKQIVSGGVVDNSMATMSSGADILSIDSQIQVMTSQAVARELILAENLTSDPEFVSSSALSGIRTALGRLLKGTPVISTAADPLYDAVLREYYQRLSVRRQANTYVVTIAFKSEDAEKAARIANHIAEIYLRQNAKATLATTQTAAEAIEARLESLRLVANSDSEAVEAYRRNNNLTGTENMLVAEQQLRDLNNQLSLARVARVNTDTDLAQARNALRAASGSNGSAFTTALDSPVLAQLQINLSGLEVTEARLRATLQSRHPALIRLNDEKAALLSGMRGELVRIVERLELAHQVALEREATIEAQVDGLESRRADLNVASVQLRELERKAAASQGVYETFLTRSKEVWEQIGLPSDMARVISTAYPPARAAEPKASMLVMAAAMLGLVVGVAWVWLAYLMGIRAFPVVRRRRHA